MIGDSGDTDNRFIVKDSHIYIDTDKDGTVYGLYNLEGYNNFINLNQNLFQYQTYNTGKLQ